MCVPAESLTHSPILQCHTSNWRTSKNTQSTHARKVRFVSPLHTTFSRGGKGWPEVPRCPPTVKVRQVGMVGVVPPDVDHLLDHLKAGVHELDAGLQLLILTGPGGVYVL